ncbi:hypothetical protein [Dongia sedimenti]|uniref:Uncharacterized protein n=1 Tax=Dongia sedimenti TaxID=3064282 RepID=A0ABU0YKM0_9PROT|nr:hypothetical protein [Rhodospirillaceae bacterium R-7]
MDPSPVHVPPVGTPLKPTQRRWRDLRFNRLVIGLVCASAVNAALLNGALFALFHLTGPQGEPAHFRTYACYAIVPTTWLVLCGLIYVYSVSRLRGQIGRIECLFIGCASTFMLLPAVFLAVSFFGSRELLTMEAFTLLPQYFPFGLATLPFGLFSGWAFWRLGVRPAMAPTAELAAVFE